MDPLNQQELNPQGLTSPNKAPEQPLEPAQQPVTNFGAEIATSEGASAPQVPAQSTLQEAPVFTETAPVEAQAPATKPLSEDIAMQEAPKATQI